MNGRTGRRRTLWLLAGTLLLLVAARHGGQAQADEPNQAGLVIQFEDGRVETRCIGFQSQAIRGVDLLTNSGLDVVIDASSGLGVTLCQVEGSGCSYPAEPCFCECMSGSQCAYWNYFYRDPGDASWSYSPLGAILREVRPGSVEAWVWGDGRHMPAVDLTFDSICAPAKPAVSPVAESTAAAPTIVVLTAESSAAAPTIVAPIADQPTSVPVPAQMPTETPRPAATAGATAADADAGPGKAGLTRYWPYALFVAALVAAGAFVLRRTAR